jgi:hypothetical protein
MMGPAQRDGIFVTDPSAEGARLSEPQMMGVRRPSAAYEARLRRYEPEVHPIAVAAGFAQRKRAFVDLPGNGVSYPLFADRPQFMRAW